MKNFLLIGAAVSGGVVVGGLVLSQVLGIMRVNQIKSNIDSRQKKYCGSEGELAAFDANPASLNARKVMLDLKMIPGFSVDEDPDAAVRFSESIGDSQNAGLIAVNQIRKNCAPIWESE